MEGWVWKTNAQLHNSNTIPPHQLTSAEVGIYKRKKQESKKTRKQELDQESDQENKK